MDKSKFSRAQGTIVETFKAPLFVAAGAGSGKTYTLKLRTANAFLENEDDFHLDSIDQVLAITFTKAAAEELLSRIKDTLLEEGLEEQAFDADQACISTIHGFCSRLLRENALELGLDPEFRLLTELEADALEREAREHVLELVKRGYISRANLVGDWNLFAKGQYDSGLVEAADQLRNKMRALPKGSGAYHHVARMGNPKDTIQGLVAIAQALVDDSAGWDKGNGRSDTPALKKLNAAIQGAEEWLRSEQAQFDFSHEELDLLSYSEVVKAFPVMSETFLRNHEGEEATDRYRMAQARSFYETAALLGVDAAEVVFQIAEAVETEFVRLKREAGALDNNDLLRMTLDALQNHEALAERYRAQFKLIMIDEFQDTDRIQIEILRLIAQPKLANVCVVGDAQQSIYRFRGADVTAFTEYRDALAAMYPEEEEDKLQPKLDWNFRSHGDILAFVDAVFKQDDSFGDDYLQLHPEGKVAKEADPVMDVRSRVQLGIQHRPRKCGVSKEQALQKSAQRIAQYFADIKQAHKDAGHDDPQTYALLLGTTDNAPVYIEALRDVGLESMMTGGSTLMSSREADTLVALLHYGLNAHDEQPLLDCLTSDLFALSDDALLALVYDKHDGSLRHVGLSTGFQSNDVSQWGLSVEDEHAVSIARDVLGRFRSRVRQGKPSEAVRSALVESGYLDRMQAAGVGGFASVGNYSKLIDVLQEVERDQVGLAEVVAGFDAKKAYAKASPGVLMVNGMDMVQIMTIHGSKGLQFDHVAVAEFKNGATRSTGMMIENEGTCSFALAAGKGFSLGDARSAMEEVLAKGAISRLQDAETPGELLALLDQLNKRESVNEARRLLYVALTRAIKSVYVSYDTSSGPTPAKGPYSGDGIIREVYEALDWDVTKGTALEPQKCEYGGTRPASVHFEVLSASEELEDEELPANSGNAEGEEGQFIVPMRKPLKIPIQVPFAGVRANVRSYSSLSPNEVNAVPAEHGAAEPGEVAADLGTAFHRLAQRSILERAEADGGALQRPSAEAVQAQKEKLNLTEGQCARLDEALEWWFASDLVKELCAAESLEAEVPFMVRVEREGSSVFLEGEIDALATTGDAAFLVDYKTGGDPEAGEEQIRAKHELQAQCYAYGLLRAGYASVKATFVRVEHQQTLTYEFASLDLQRLEQEILSHWPS